MRDLFPENFPYEPFGDPYESKRHMEEEREQRKPEIPNSADIPEGTYRGSCTVSKAWQHGQGMVTPENAPPPHPTQGCSLTDESTLTCTQCVNTRLKRVTSSISINACQAGDVIGNHNGQLACEAAPTVNPRVGSGPRTQGWDL